MAKRKKVCDWSDIYHPTLQDRIGCALGAHDWKEYEMMKGKYYCLRDGCCAFRGFKWFDK